MKIENIFPFILSVGIILMAIALVYQVIHSTPKIYPITIYDGKKYYVGDVTKSGNRELIPVENKVGSRFYE